MKKNVGIIIIGMMLIFTTTIVIVPAKNISNINTHCEEDIIQITSSSSSNLDINFKWIGGATWILTIGELKLACDPVLSPKGTVLDFGLFKSERIEEPAFTNEDFQNIDIWFITHDDIDHLDEIGLTKIDSESIIVTHKDAIDELKTTNSDNILSLKWCEKKTLNIDDFEVCIEAIPAIHAKNLLIALSAGGGNGYLVTIKSNEETISIYITGDTVAKWIVLNSIRCRKVDLFIPNMGGARLGNNLLGKLFGPLTLTARMMKRMKNCITPEVTIPVHFGTFSHYIEPISKVEKWNDPSIEILKPGEKITIKLT